MSATRGGAAGRGRLRRLWARLRRQARQETITERATRPLDQDSGSRAERAAPCGALEPGGAVLAGSYVTDGCSLFRVEQAYVDTRSGVRLLELENCATIELSVCSPDEFAARSLRCVTPAEAANLSEATLEPKLGGALDGLTVDGSEVTAR